MRLNAFPINDARYTHLVSRCDWSSPEACYVDGPSMFGKLYLKVPGLDDTTQRHHPKARVERYLVGVALGDDGQWYWIVETKR